MTNLKLVENFYFNESAAQDILLTPDQALIPGTQKRKMAIEANVRVP
jgi:hypothetical protein